MLGTILSFYVRNKLKRYKNNKQRQTNEIGSRLSIGNWFLIIWSISEIMILAFVLFKKGKKDYPTNFLGDLCASENCDHRINSMIGLKILSSLFLAIGVKYVSKL